MNKRQREQQIKNDGGRNLTPQQQRALTMMARTLNTLHAQLDAFRNVNGDCRGLLADAAASTHSAANALCEMQDWNLIFPLGTSARQNAIIKALEGR